MGEIIISNRMKAQYDLKGYRESSIDTIVTVGVYLDSNIENEVYVRAKKNNDISIDVNVMYGNNSEVLVDVQPGISDYIDVEITINPHNRMGVMYELTEPPLTNFNTFPVQDTFTASNTPYNIINYGHSNSMKIGQDSMGDNTAFIQFDTSSIPKDSVIKTAKLKLYYNNYQNQSLDVYRIIGNWGEYSLTHNNSNVQLIHSSNIVTINRVDRYVEIDVTNLVSQWVQGIKNNGLVIKSPDSVSIFKTREFPAAPELNVTFFTSKPISINSSRQLVEFDVRQKTHNDINIEVDIVSTAGFSFVDLEVYAHHPNIPLLSDIDVSVEVAQYDNDYVIPIEVDIAIPMMDSINIEVEVPQYIADNDIDIDVTVWDRDSSVVDVEIEVNEYQLDSDIDVDITVYDKDNSYIDIEIIARQSSYSDILVEFEVPSDGTDKSIIDIEVEVNGYENNSTIDVLVDIAHTLDSSIDVEVIINEHSDDSSIDIDIEVPIRVVDEDLDIEIGVWGYNTDIIEVEMSARVPYLDQIDIEVIVGNKRVGKSYVYII